MISARNKYIRRTPAKHLNTVAERNDKLADRDTDLPMLARIKSIWFSHDDMRRAGTRLNRFAYGDQWGDPIEINGKTMTYRQYLKSTGNVVLQTNQIKNKIETIAGVVAKEQNGPEVSARDEEKQMYAQVVTEGLKANCDINIMQVLYDKYMKALGIYGIAVNYEGLEYFKGEMDSVSEFVEPNTLFFESNMSDPRGEDISLIGRFMDLPRSTLLAKFSRSTRDYDVLKSIYPEAFDPFARQRSIQATDKIDELEHSFSSPQDPTKCRVFEVWTKECRPKIRMHDTQAGVETIVDYNDHKYRAWAKAENERRIADCVKMGWPVDEAPLILGDGYGRDESEKNGLFWEEFWYFRFLAPDGTVLMSGESPYPDRNHPFTILLIPLTGGKVCGYLTDAVDHNIAMNRALVLDDWLKRSGAKGVTVVPKSIVPKDVSFEQFAKSWTTIDDLVFVDIDETKKDLMPKVFFSQSNTFDVSRQLDTLHRLMENSTTVNDAIQGRAAHAGMSGSMYAQMVSNSSTPISSLLTSFHMFLRRIYLKKMSNMLQEYTLDRWERIAGTLFKDSLETKILDLKKIANIQYDVAVIDNTNTATYREKDEEDLQTLLLNKIIAPEEYFKHSNKSYAKLILKDRQAQQQEDNASAQVMAGAQRSGGGEMQPEGEIVPGAPGLAPDVQVNNGRATIVNE